MRKIFRYLFLGVGLLYTYAIARVLSHAFDDEQSFEDNNDMLIH